MCVCVPGPRHSGRGAHVSEPAEQARSPALQLARVPRRARRASPGHGEAPCFGRVSSATVTPVSLSVPSAAPQLTVFWQRHLGSRLVFGSRAVTATRRASVWPAPGLGAEAVGVSRRARGTLSSCWNFTDASAVGLGVAGGSRDPQLSRHLLCLPGSPRFEPALSHPSLWSVCLRSLCLDWLRAVTFMPVRGPSGHLSAAPCPRCGFGRG